MAPDENYGPVLFMQLHFFYWSTRTCEQYGPLPLISRYKRQIDVYMLPFFHVLHNAEGISFHTN